MLEKSNRFEQHAKIFTLALLTASLLIGLMIAELFFRFFKNQEWQAEKNRWDHALYMMLENNSLEYSLRPGVSRENKIPDSETIWHYRINSDGFRDNEFSTKDARQRVLFIGDSYTFGWGVNQEDILSHLVKSELAAEPYLIDLNTYNLGVPGYNTVQEAALLEEAMVKYRPDLIVLGFVMNDAKPQHTVPRQPTFHYGYATSWLLAETLALFNRYLFDGEPIYNSGIVDPKAKLTMDFGSRSWMETRLAFSRIAALCREENVPLILIIHPAYAQHLDSRYPYTPVHKEVAKWATQEKVIYVDMLPWITGSDRRTLQVIGDGHPNRLAFEQTARVLAPTVFRALTLPHR
ncbi:SGNH/GDSL hydrolase family protein [bacterium]|nr:SGNH/GDSL hydrolase family protein [bacterium]